MMKVDTFNFMIYINMKYKILSVLFAFVALTSCIDDLDSCVDDYGIPEEIRSGYSINLTVTLDKMGGSSMRAGNEDYFNPLEDRDDYINPEKFRVLFFDHQDKFLFESKSRWVKKLYPSADYSEWLVSVPMFTYGNDKFEVEEVDEATGETKKVVLEWDWETIRKALQDNKFKIAILANRPELDWYPAFDDTKEYMPKQWYDNRGPFWDPRDTGEKEVFDLHHCQYDPMYHGKSQENGYYDFIMGDWGDFKASYNDFVKKKPTMGATSSWVYWGDGFNYGGINPRDYDEKFPYGNSATEIKNLIKYTILPDSDNPIPMYGIQEFDPITDWVKGTPFNLSNLLAASTDQEDNQNTDPENKRYNYKSIALLRSVVKLELIIPKSLYPNEPQFVGLWYSNIYARCEPMNVWDPTDLIWKENHENDCEWNDIMNYGPIWSKLYKLDGSGPEGGNNVRYLDSQDTEKDLKVLYQTCLSWFYGAWTTKKADGSPRWNFEGEYFSIDKVVPEKDGMKYPQIFNPCIQRNKLVQCNIEGDVTDLYDDNCWHYVVYTGERNMIDPNDLPMTAPTSSKNNNAYAINWMFGRAGSYYCIPIADYSTDNGKSGNTRARNCFGPYDYTSSTNLQGNMNSYANNIRDESRFLQRDEMPLPLLRNHVYRITIGSRTNRGSSGEGFSVQTEDFHSESIKFK